MRQCASYCLCHVRLLCGKSSKTFSLSRSKSIASARDKWKISSSYGLLPFLSKENSKNNLNDSLDKSSDEHLRKESDNLRLRLNTETQERQRLEREVDRFVKLYDQCQVKFNIKVMLISCKILITITGRATRDA